MLCPLLADSRPHVRSNALVGLAGANARCADHIERRLLLEDPSERVRTRAASVVAVAASDADTSALERCVQGDRSAAVARGCRSARVGKTEGASKPSRALAVDVYVVPEAAQGPKPRAHYFLELSDGTVRAGTADRRGALFEPRAPDGELALDRNP